MILDNADDAATFFGQAQSYQRSTRSVKSSPAPSLASFLPQAPNGCIVSTSRSEDVAFRLTGNHKNIIRLEPMDWREGIALLEKKLHNRFEKDVALELLQALDYMPLAITQAAAYLNRLGARGSLLKYLELLQKSDDIRASLLNKETSDLRRDEHASNSVIITWQISFQRIREANPSAAEMLSLMSFFDRQGIPEFMLRNYANNHQDDNEGVEPELKFEDDLATLRSYCLINTDTESHMFDMHRLVQLATRRWLAASGDLNFWRRKFLRILSAEHPPGDYTYWSKCKILLPHAEAAAMDEPTDEHSLRDWSLLLTNAASYASARGRYGAAESMARKAMSAAERGFGLEHPATLKSMNILAGALLHDGKLKAAEETYRRALNICQVSGQDHPSIPTMMGELALVLAYQGYFQKAEETNEEALKMHEKVVGKDHLAPSTIMNSMALILIYQGKYQVAEETIRRHMDAYEKVLSKDHPATLLTMNILSWTLVYQGRYKEAEDLNRQGQNRFQNVLGRDHPAVLGITNSLAAVLGRQGKFRAAEEMGRSVLTKYERILGKNHTATLESLIGLSTILGGQGKYEAAEELIRGAMEGREKEFGKEHPDTLRSADCLAYALKMRGNCKAAAEICERAYTSLAKVLGSDHPATVGCYRNYSSILQDIAILAHGHKYRLRQLVWIVRGAPDSTAASSRTSSSRKQMLLQHLQQLAEQRAKQPFTWRRLPRLPPAFDCDARDLLSVSDDRRV